jgi:DNA-binding transcriptional LysR family regulator
MAKQSVSATPQRNLFEGLPQFLAVARLASFRAAAQELGVTPGAVSQSIKTLEARLGVLLFIRTTRNVALTEAGARLADRLSGIRETVEQAIEQTSALQDRPSGTLRLCIRRMAIPTMIERAIPLFRKSYPEVSLDIEVRDGPIDLVGEGFDAGMRIGEFLEPDMIAVRIGEQLRWVVVASPDYLKERGVPQRPADIVRHECIRFRFAGPSEVYRWEFRDKGRGLRVDPPGKMVVTDSALLCALAAEGMGLAYASDVAAQAGIRNGRLATVLEKYMPPTDNLFLYFAARSQSQPKLRAFIDTLVVRT